MNQSFWKTLREDFAVLTVKNTNTFTMIVCLFTRSGFQAVFLYRLSALLVHRGLLGRILAIFFSRLNIFFNACDISPYAVIGSGFKLPHPTGIVIGHSVIGRNVMMLQNTTLGLRRFTDDEQDPVSYPVIEDDVIICAGAVVVGHVRIGRAAIIGANAVVNKDVPEKATAVGVPARVLP